MADDRVTQDSDVVYTSRKRPNAEPGVSARSIWFLSWLLLLALVVGIVSLLSYSLAGSELVRSGSPTVGAWWEAHQFLFMEGGATAAGLLLGMAIGETCMAGQDRRFRASLIALVLAIITFAPLVHLCALTARLGWSGRVASLTSWITSHAGYDAGRHVDKIVIAGVYFLKTAGLAFLAGLSLAAIACVAIIAVESANAEIA
jgi:hypothetical protein